MTSKVSQSTRTARHLAAALGLGLFMGCGIASSLDQGTATPAAWNGPQGFDLTSEITEQAPSLAMDASSNVFAAWDQLYTGADQVLVDAYSGSGSAWLTPETLPNQSGSAQDPSVALGNGVFGVAWDQTVSGTSVIGFAFWTPSGGFSSPWQLSPGPASSPVTAMDAGGDAAVAWTELLPSGLTAIQVQRYTAGSTNSWASSLVTVSTTTTANAFSPRVGMNALGDVVVAWLEAANPATGPYTLKTAWFTAGSVQAWSAPFSPQVAASDALAPGFALAMNSPSSANGVARLAWAESTDGATFQIYTAAFDPAAATWTTGLKVSAAAVNAFQPALGLDTSGDALLAWVQGASGTASGPAPDLWAAAYTSGTGAWSTPAGVVTGTSGVQAPSLAMSPGGYGVLAWQQVLGSNWRILASLNAPGYGWSSQALLNVVTGGDASAPAAAYAAGDQAAVVAWSQPDALGVQHVYTNIYQ